MVYRIFCLYGTKFCALGIKNTMGSIRAWTRVLLRWYVSKSFVTYPPGKHASSFHELFSARFLNVLYFRNSATPEVMDMYARVGFPGAIGSTGCVHNRWNRCPTEETFLHIGKCTKCHYNRVRFRRSYTIGKDNVKIMFSYQKSTNSTKIAYSICKYTKF